MTNFPRKTWVNGPSTLTPLEATTGLNDLEARVSDTVDSLGVDIAAAAGGGGGGGVTFHGNPATQLFNNAPFSSQLNAATPTYTSPSDFGTNVAADVYYVDVLTSGTLQVSHSGCDLYDVAFNIYASAATAFGSEAGFQQTYNTGGTSVTPGRYFILVYANNTLPINYAISVSGVKVKGPEGEAVFRGQSCQAIIPDVAMPVILNPVAPSFIVATDTAAIYGRAYYFDVEVGGSVTVKVDKFLPADASIATHVVIFSEAEQHGSTGVAAAGATGAYSVGSPPAVTAGRYYVLVYANSSAATGRVTVTIGPYANAVLDGPPKPVWLALGSYLHADWTDSGTLEGAVIDGMLVLRGSVYMAGTTGNGGTILTSLPAALNPATTRSIIMHTTPYSSTGDVDWMCYVGIGGGIYLNDNNLFRGATTRSKFVNGQQLTFDGVSVSL